jgi:hypothetical protein
MNQVIRMVRSFVDSEMELKFMFRKYDGSRDDDVNIDDNICVFDPINYLVLFQRIEVQKDDMLISICRILWNLYQVEWSDIISRKTFRFCKDQIVTTTNPRLLPMERSQIPKHLSDVRSLRGKFNEFLNVTNGPESSLVLDGNGSIYDIGK